MIFDFGFWIIYYRWWLILARFILLLASTIGVQYLTINNDTRVFFSEANPQFKALEVLENTYTKDQSVVFVISPKTASKWSNEITADAFYIDKA